MTRKEMTEIFSVMSLAWPSAEMFKGGVEHLGPTISLWTSALPEVDFWTGQQAVVKLCRECKFPPTIAEFKEKAEEVHKDIGRFVGRSIGLLKARERAHGSLAAAVESLPDGSTAKAVVEAMGGADALVERVDDQFCQWNYNGFEQTYIALIRKDPSMFSGKPLPLPNR